MIRTQTHRIGTSGSPPNPRLQRTRWRAPLSRQPLGASGGIV